MTEYSASAQEMDYVTVKRTYMMVLVIMLNICQIKSLNSPSPLSEFLMLPSNTTALVGDHVVMKCKIASPVHRCRWYYLENGLDFFSSRVNPVMVMDFVPERNNDCSIKFTKVLEVQEGQWLCQGTQYHRAVFITSPPAMLNVITADEAATMEPPIDERGRSHPIERDENEMDSFPTMSENDITFQRMDNDHIQNTHLEASVNLWCKVNRPIERCSWVMPSGEIVSDSKETSMEAAAISSQTYTLQDGFSEGNCSLRIQYVKLQDEGNWHCLVKLPLKDEELEGPLIHLHILQYDHILDQVPHISLTSEEHDMTLLSVLLVITAIVLFILLIMLLTCLYQRVRVTNEETHKILQTTLTKTDNENNSYEIKKGKSRDFNLQAYSDNIFIAKGLPAEYLTLENGNQYLDMSGTGSATDGYILMPETSVRSSTSSRTTLSTLSTMPACRSRSVSNATTSSSRSSTRLLHTLESFENLSYQPEPTDKERPISLYSTGHVYEEIQEKEPNHADPHLYTNLREDPEGYMIPKDADSNQRSIQDSTPENGNCTSGNNHMQSEFHKKEQQSENTEEKEKRSCPMVSPYSYVGRTDNESPNPAKRAVSNPGYSLVGQNSRHLQHNYDSPRSTPIPLTGSYDIPRSRAGLVSDDIPELSETHLEGLPGIIV